MSSIEIVHPQPAARPLHLLEPVERLPSEQSKSWFLALQQRRADALTLYQATAEELRETRAELHVAETRKKQLTMPRMAGGHGLKSEDFSVQDISGTIANLKAKMARLTELAADRSSRLDRIGTVVNRCEDLLRMGAVPGGVKIAAAAVVSVKDLLRKNESLRDAVARLQMRGREIAADQHRESSRPYPSSDARAKAREAIGARARPPIVSGMIEHGGDLIWPTQMMRLDLAAISGAEQNRVVGSAMGEVEDVLGVVCWLLSGPMASEIDKLIDAEADDAEAVTADEREVRLAELERERLHCERQECALVWHLMDSGEAIEHRPDISPLAVLSLELMTVA